MCRHPGVPLRHWPGALSREAYARRFGEPPAGLDLVDYELFRCNHCRLRFASPATPGDAAFYGWITNTDNYYDKDRWEWNVVVEDVASLPSLECPKQPLSVLEVGCGTGQFLKHLGRSMAVRALGADTHAPSASRCRAEGLDVITGGIEHVDDARRFDVICAFHCLEHVSDPLDFVSRARDRLHPQGTLYLSVPLSPTLWDVLHDDCLNLPPHHLTQWGVESLGELSRQVGMDLALRTPTPGTDRLRCILYAMSDFDPRLRSLKPASLITRVLTNGRLRRTFFRLAHHFLTRPRIDGVMAGDVVLATMRPR